MLYDYRRSINMVSTLRFGQTFIEVTIYPGLPNQEIWVEMGIFGEGFLNEVMPELYIKG